MKAIPNGKVDVGLIWCQECEVWYLKDECSLTSMMTVHDDDHQFTSDYNGRHYYSEYYKEDVWSCPDGCWIWDPNDGDVSTPRTAHTVPWKCTNCENFYPDKDEADACCA